MKFKIPRFTRANGKMQLVLSKFKRETAISKLNDLAIGLPSHPIAGHEQEPNIIDARLILERLMIVLLTFERSCVCRTVSIVLDQALQGRLGRV